MTQSNPPEIPPTQKQRKTYFPFKFMLRSAEYQGIGSSLAENCEIQDGRLDKMKGQEIWKDTVTPDGIVWMGGYEKSDGTYQVLYAYKSGAIYLLRAVEEDDLSIVTPTGGAGDVNFTSSNFDFTSIGTTGYISNESATTPMYSWDGATLTSITNAPASPAYLLRDGNRLATNKSFSDEAPADWTGGAGVTASGDYAMSIEPTGGVVAGAGIIVFGKLGAESHKVIPNNASDNVSAKTKIEGFNYTGLGIQNTHQCVAGGNFVYFFNSDGIFEMNPYDGSTTNLAESGNIEKRWRNFNLTNSFIDYDTKNKKIVIVVRTLGQNDTMVTVDIEWKERPISIATGAFFSSSATVNNQYYAGSSHDGNILKMFETFTNRDATALQFRYIIEWDAITNAMFEKRLKRFAIFANLNPQSSFTAKIYKDGSHEPFKTQTFTTTASLQGGSLGTVLAPWGKYVFNMGGDRDTDSTNSNTDKIQRSRSNSKVSTYTIEILEKSFYDFTLNDILLEYKTKGRLIPVQTLPNTLF